MDNSHLLADLESLEPGQRLERLAMTGDAVSQLEQLVEHAETLVILDLAKAQRAATLLIDLGDAVPVQTVRTRARRCLAQTLAYANRFDEALDILRTAIQIAESAEDETEAARLRLTSLHALARLGRYDEAIAEGEAARDVLLRHNRLDLVARANINLGVTHRMRDDPSTALRHFDEAMELLTDQTLIAQLESNRAEALLDLNRFREAEAAFKNAREQFDQLGHARAAAIVEGNLADLLSRQGRFTEALAHFVRAEKSFDDQQAPGDLGRLQAEHAELLANIGLWNEAAEYYRAALPMLDEHRLAFEASRARTGLGRVLTAMGQLEDADAVLIEAASAFEQLGHQTGLARVKILQADLESRRRRNDDARQLLVECLDLLQDRPAERAIAQGQLAALALATYNVNAAEALLEEALDVAKELNLAPRLAELLGLRAQVHQMQGKFAAMRDDLRAGVEQVERLRGTLQSIRLRHAWQAGRIDLYENLVLALLDDEPQPLPAEAFAVCERARARSFLDQIAAPVAHTPATAADMQSASPRSAEFETVVQLRAELNALYSRLDELKPSEEGATVDTDWRTEVEQCERQLALAEHRLEALQEHGSLFADPATLERIQHLLSPETTLIEYFIAGDEVLAFIVTANHMDVVRELGTRDDLREAIERLDFQIMRTIHHLAGGNDEAQATRDAFEQELRQLGEMIVVPLRESINAAKQVIIIPHGPLHNVPFHALRVNDRYLVELSPVSVLPSASVMEHLHATKQHTDDRDATDLVVSVPDDAAPMIAVEAQTVARALPGAVELSGPQATVDAFLKQCSHCRLMHLACHGRFSSRHPETIGLKMADGWLTMRDLNTLDLRGAVVTLSGCETGRNMIGSADELVGVTRALFAAGASYIVMSQWMTHDEFTAEMMASVYSLWHNTYGGCESSMSAALRDVQLDLLRKNTHPIHWASFAIVGTP